VILTVWRNNNPPNQNLMGFNNKPELTTRKALAYTHLHAMESFCMSTLPQSSTANNADKTIIIGWVLTPRYRHAGAIHSQMGSGGGRKKVFKTKRE